MGQRRHERPAIGGAGYGVDPKQDQTVWLRARLWWRPTTIWFVEVRHKKLSCTLIVVNLLLSSNYKERRRELGKILDRYWPQVEAHFSAAVTADGSLRASVNEAGWELNLSSVLREQLGVEITAGEIKSTGSLRNLSGLLETRLPRDPMERSLVDIYATLEQFVTEELSHEFKYDWYATWKGDLLKNTDSLDDVEIVMRMEEFFGFSIPDCDVQAMQTVGQTVRYLWQRSREQSFTLRQRPSDVCPACFIFHELRRLLVIRGGVSRTDVRLDTQLGDLLPTWYFQFWKHVQVIFGVDIPHGNLLTRSFGFEKRTTIKELVALISSGNKH